jgi:NAD(P)-dependent dehydrogenase (short-subunit alcohol dehydrogenase family)
MLCIIKRIIATMDFNFSNPYTSTRIPVLARNVVSTSHPLAAQAGLRMLYNGGNAVDAAIAAAAAMTLCEPASNGLGSPEEIASIILWISSVEGGYATGADFSLNGGLHMG